MKISEIGIRRYGNSHIKNVEVVSYELLKMLRSSEIAPEILDKSKRLLEICEQELTLALIIDPKNVTSQLLNRINKCKQLMKNTQEKT